MSCIDAATKIGIKNISTYRKHLVDKGFIGYDGYSILIDWIRIRAFAAIDRKKMGKMPSWNISPVASNCYESVKSQVHNYIGTSNSESVKLQAIYEATAEAIAHGVKFPELRSDYIGYEEAGMLDAKQAMYGLSSSVSVGWFNPFDEPDPEWVYQIPLVDAYGEIVAYAHYNTQLPF